MSDTIQPEAAPKYLRDAVLDIVQARDEIREATGGLSRAMSEFAAGVGQMIANDEMILGELRGLRDEVRARLSNHDREIGDLRTRLDKLEQRSFIPGDELREEFRDIRRRLDNLETDGK
jgi:hypothetical protein